MLKTHCCAQRYSSTDAVHSQDYWFSLVPASQICEEPEPCHWMFSGRRKHLEAHTASLGMLGLFFFFSRNSNHWPMLLCISFVTTVRWRSEIRLKLAKWNQDFRADCKSHNKFSGGKAENDLNFVLKSLGNIKLIWVGSTAI